MGLSNYIPDFTNVELCKHRYRCEQRIGSGGFGVVYRAIDREASGTTSPQCAIKIVTKRDPSAPNSPSDMRYNSRLLDQIRREVDLHRLVSSHRNIVTLRDTFEDNDFAYLVLDFCPGPSLIDIVQHYGVYWRNDELVKKTFLQILDAVDHCHHNDVFHRDIKPDNILTSLDGTMYLSDFGLSCNNRESFSTRTGSIMYMSPECMGDDYEPGRPYSTRHNDIFSLGIVLINILVSCAPWRFPTVDDSGFVRYLDDPDYFIQSYPISQAAHRLLCKMTKLEPSSRPGIHIIRLAIQKMDTFFMTDEELAGPYGTAANRAVAKECKRKAGLRGSIHAKWKQSIHLSPSIEESDITSVPMRMLREMYDPSLSSNQDRTDDVLDIFKPSAPHHGFVPQTPVLDDKALEILRNQWSDSAPVESDLEDMLDVQKSNGETTTRSGQSSSKVRADRLGLGDEFVIGSVSSVSDSSGPITPETHAVVPEIQVEDIPSLLNPQEENLEMLEVDLGEISTKAKFFDVNRILNTPPIWKMPSRCRILEQNPVIEQKEEKKQWFVRDFRKLRRKNNNIM